MARHLTALINLFWLCFACTIHANANGQSFEDTVQQLAKNYAEIKEVLEAKMVRLETKVIGLESKMQQQNAIVMALQNERHSDEVEIKLHETKAIVDDLAIKLSERTSAVTDIGKMPTSCSDLQHIGHRISGLYSVMGTRSVETVYCNFHPNAKEMQKWIGYVDVKSASTYFYVTRSSPFMETNIPIPFDVEQLNIGGAMNLQTGKFVAPRAGKYSFSISGVAYFPFTQLTAGLYNETPVVPSYRFQISLIKNGNWIGSGYSHATNTGGTFETFALDSTLGLIKNDQVWVEISEMSDKVLLYGRRFTHFTGVFLEENLAP
ncbi:hypothetical protein GHT06_014542 [Daphnia sinensis]|uniref:C1q domain-containing protein n=1 Tax=Daphnia sinensis TaxID=1820382 RepID=A0AAD5LHH3_9CRUS|nr:hypothetical protein GHT06_014542 [Daphnia sinensis]